MRTISRGVPLAAILPRVLVISPSRTPVTIRDCARWSENLVSAASRLFEPLHQILVHRGDFAHLLLRVGIPERFGLDQDFFGACSQAGGPVALPREHGK